MSSRSRLLAVLAAVTALGLPGLAPALRTPAARDSGPSRSFRAAVDEFGETLERVLLHRSRPKAGSGLKQIGLQLPIYHDAFLASQVKEDDLRPGLVTTYRDAANVEIVQLEPTIALALKAGEAPHPRLSADGGTVRWEGYVNVLRAGGYRFSAMLRGKLSVRVADKEVLAAEVRDAAPVLKEGPETRLEAGVHPIVAEFTRRPGAARAELSWTAAHFVSEPVPFDMLGHLPKQTPERLKTDALIEHGRFVAEERNCAGCHRPAEDDRLGKGLHGRQGPDLSQVGGRAHAGWLYAWLEAPHKLRPGAVMPQAFADDAAGKVERYAVACYLASLGGPLKPAAKSPDAKNREASIARGQRLFVSVGCVACHPTPEASRGRQPPTRQREVTGMGSKTTPEKLSAYLQDPLVIDPSGRMPHMLLQPKEADDLARYLGQFLDKNVSAALPLAPAKEEVHVAFHRAEPSDREHDAFQKLLPDAQLVELGKRLVVERGCANCHTIAPGGKPLANVHAAASFDDIKKPARHDRGCLASAADKRGKAPSFPFDEDERKGLLLFLTDGTKGAGSPAPAHAARAALQRFNCLACHSRDGEGGLSEQLVEHLRQYEKAENAEAVMPPPLTGAAHKLRTPWLRQVLTQTGRGRPWMGLRMPQFGEANVGHLPEALAALEGTVSDDQVHKVPLTTAKIEAGRQLVGKSAFGCISCHDLAGVPNFGTRGPDLAGMNQRVRYDWYRRWLEQPQRMQPGTRMPTVFSDGKSLFDKVLAGSADAQAEAMWAYLSLGPSLPLPEGMEPPKGLIVVPTDRPALVRTFLPDAGTRAVAVGYPGGVSAAFDAATCRLAYAWSGNFLDAAPVWDGRGGDPAKLLGPRFWTAPPGCPWEVAAAADPPDFAARAKDPAYGASLPEGKVFTGSAQLRFEGYRTDAAGRPTFRYLLHPDTEFAAEVTERPEPLRSPAGVGVARHFTIHVPARQTAWLLAGEAKKEPLALDESARSIPLNLKADAAEIPAATRLLVLPQDGDRVIALSLAAAPEGSCWVLRRQGASWQALLQLPAAKEAGRREVGVRVWAPYRDEPALLKELLSSR